MALAAVQAAWAEESWLGLYLQGAKVGWTRTERLPGGEEGGRRTISETRMETRLLGQTMVTTIQSESQTNAQGMLLSYTFQMLSQGRELSVSARKSGSVLRATSRAGGEESVREIAIPAGVVVIEDPLEAVDLALGKPQKATVFDPLSLSLVEVEITPKQGEKVDGQDVQVLRIEDPRGPLTVYSRPNGDVIRIDGPLGLQMKPETKEQALDMTGAGPSDLADASSILPKGRVSANAAKITYRVRGGLKDLPQDGHQTVRRDGSSFIVTTRPVGPKDAPGTLKLGEAGGMEKWTQPDIRVPSNLPEFRELAKQYAGDAVLAMDAAERIRMGVYRRLRVNAGIGVMRDAQEVLSSGEGVCRDHAVLMAALLRSVGIPTRLVNGIVHQDGRFYYHAWVEAWNGSAWIGFDSTRPAPRLTAGHIKTVQGGVSDVMVGFLIDGAEIEVLPSGGN
jgi:hypothetical protein